MQQKSTVWLTLIVLVLVFAAVTQGQPTHRPDVIWARYANTAMTLDGVLDEPGWAVAESIRVQYGLMGDQIPGSGQRTETGVEPSDPLDATVKFLIHNADLYIAVTVKDSSVGGGLFNKFDGFLLNIRDAASPNRPAGPFEYFYGWVTEGWADPNSGLPGAQPGFFGWAAGDRTVWDAATVVHGLANNDTLLDMGYTVEFRFSLAARGYDATQPDGVVIPFNMSIYDADWQWPYDEAKFSGNRTWIQGPWGNASAYNVLRIHARPDVTTDSKTVPPSRPDVVIPNADGYTEGITIDGVLAESVWANAPGIDLRFGDAALRESYPGVGPLMSGEWQPEINGVRAPILDPADATIKWFFREDMLFLGVDVRDQSVMALENFDQWDGIRFIINDIAATDEFEGNQLRRELTLRFDAAGKVIWQEYLSMIIDSLDMGAAACSMKPGTTIGDVNDIDAGYYFELAFDLKALGYPAGLGAGDLFISATLFDGDAFPNSADDYGNRVWWMREGAWNAGPAWGYLDPYTSVPGVSIKGMERPDAIWARTTTSPINLDGKLDEPAWSKAETFRLRYNKAGVLIPGSGSRIETGVEPSDPTDAFISFLVHENKLYVGVFVKDASVGGGLFNRFDGLLMNLRDRSKPDRPVANFEYFYGWVTEGWADPNTGNVGASPGFFGWAAGDRTVWDAVTVVDGISNDDATPDFGYTTELVFDLTARGYDVTSKSGDILEFNISIYDADWQWPLIEEKFSGNRTWWQGPWGNGSAYAIGRIYARPDVTEDTPLPIIGPDIIIENGADYPAPTVDGNLDEAIWANIAGMDIRFGDDELRSNYGNIGPWRSGQWQPAIDGVTAPVVDPADATLKWFFQGDMLYIGVDVRDQAVWALENFDQWDGVRIIINDRAARDEWEHNLLRREFTLRFDQNGVIAQDYFTTLIPEGLAYASFMLKPGSTINDFNDIDTGYNFEIGIDLKGLGYPAGLGDGVLFISATLFDGDNFPNAADNYGNRVWWMREGGWNAGPAWALMDVNTKVPTGVEVGKENKLPKSFELLGNYPNPFNPETTIRYAMPENGSVKLRVYDLLGRTVHEQLLGAQAPGVHEVRFNASNIGSGVYFCQIEMTSAKTRQVSKTHVQKMLVIK